EAIRREADHAAAYRARAWVHRRRHDYERAIADYTELLRLAPDDVTAYNQRGMCWYFKGDHERALADHEQALSHAPHDAASNNSVAWLLATCPEDHRRNGARALELATRACELTEWRQATFLDTLAAAHAECGRFAEAVTWAEKAVGLAPESDRPEYQGRLE